MGEAFDPYLQWLGIRDPQRPPNFYRLLGVSLFEDDPVILTNAADRQMSHVRHFQSGPHAAESQRILNELAAAKLCLLHPQRKAEYDAWLRAELAALYPQAAAPLVPDYQGAVYADPVQPFAQPFDQPYAQPIVQPIAQPIPHPAAAPAAARSTLVKLTIGALSGLVLLLIALIVWVASRGGPSPAGPAGPLAGSPPIDSPAPAPTGAAGSSAGVRADPSEESPAPDAKPAAPEPASPSTPAAGSLKEPATAAPADGARPPRRLPIMMGADDDPLQAARIALQNRDLATAAAQLELAEKTASDLQRAEIDRLREALGPLSAFWRAVHRGMAELKPGETLEVNGRTFVVREVAADALVLQDGQDEVHYTLAAIPSSLVLAIADRALAGLPSSSLLKAAFVTFDPDSDKQLARQWCERAAQEGLPTAALLAELDPQAGEKAEVQEEVPAEKTAAAPAEKTATEPAEEAAEQTAGKTASRLPIPDPADQAVALAEVDKIHREDFGRADTPARKIALSRMLFKEAVETPDEPVIRYVLLCQARDLAVTAGDPELLRTVIDEMAEHYEVDGLKHLIGLLEDVAELRVGSTGKKELAAGTLALANERIAQDDYESAHRLARAAQLMALRRDSTLSKEAADLLRAVPRLEREFQRFQQAQVILAEDPDNPVANLAQGQYYCFVKGTPADWAKGLPMLAKGSDAKLKALAEAELALARSKPDPIAAFELAEQWYEASHAADEISGESYRRRAAYWYGKALPGLQGFKERKAKLRLEEMKSGN